MSAASSDEVLVTLTRQVHNDLALRPVCTRVTFRTGVNLRAVRPDQVGDKALLGTVVATLMEMGYTL